ncbi:MAG: hypothetical protein U0Z44_07305 [Kouleothrix sp.]
MADQDVLLPFAWTNDSRWLIEVHGFDPALEPTIEAVCALVNGYSGTRAALEEGTAVSRPASFIAGVFNTPEQPQTPELEAPISELVVVPDWSRVQISVEGHSLRLDQAELLSQRRVLDMRRGVLLRGGVCATRPAGSPACAACALRRWPIGTHWCSSWCLRPRTIAAASCSRAWSMGR